MTLEDLIQELTVKVDGINSRLDAMGAPAGGSVTVDLTPVLDAIASVKADVEAIKTQVTPA